MPQKYADEFEVFGTFFADKTANYTHCISRPINEDTLYTMRA